MKLWGYYAFHTFINSFKKIFRSTFIVVMAAIIGIGVIFGASAGILATILEDELSTEDGDETQREGYGDPEYGMFDENGQFLFYDDLHEDGLGGYDENGDFIYYEDALDQNLGYYDENGDFVFYFEEITEEDFAKILLAVEAGVFALVLLLLGFGVHSGMKKGSDIFVMADVNFLFTAPMKPQSVLLFRLTFQMIAVMTGSIYLLFQIPNLVLNAGIPLEVCLLGFFALIIVFVFQKLVSVGTYTITATHPKTQKFVVPGLIILAVAVLGIYGLTYVACDQDIWKALELSYASPWTRLIPLVGWMKGVVIHAVNGNIPMVLVYLVLNLLGMVALVYGIWHMKADFYEDAMAGAQTREDMMLAAAENRKVIEVKADGTVKKDKRKVKDEHASLFGKAQGAVTFFAKERIVRRRLAKFGFATTTMLWYFTICVGMAVLNTKVLDIQDFTVTGVILMAVLFFRNYGNPIAQESSMNWLFLVPESPYKKVFYAMMAGSYASAMDLLPGMAVAMLIMKISPLTMLLWFVTLVTMDFMLSGVGLLLEALFPASAMETVKAVIQMMLKFVVIIFVVAAIVVGVVLGGFELGLILTLIMNVIMGGVCFMIYPSMLHGGIA